MEKLIITQKYIDQLTYKILGCAIDLLKYMGPGWLESVYEKCFVHDLSLIGLKWEAQRKVPLNYKGLNLEADLRYDILVEDILIVEIKSIDGILPVHQAQLLTYMRLLEKPKGIIINFNCTNIMREGQKTLVNEIYWNLPKE